MKKFLLSLFIFISISFSSFAQVRECVGIVRRQFSDVHMKFIEDSKPVLSKKEQQAFDRAEKIKQDKIKENNTKETEYNENVDKDSFGSGFVIQMDDGTNYVITNNHVIRDCTKAMIEFINNGESVIYYDLEVIAASSEYDLAILAFPKDTKPLKNALKLSDVKVNDGDEVWSAGYPGLRNKPEWQLAKGNITSSKAVVEELLKSKYSTIMQHSAPIDAGNSGGPLLVADNSAIGFSVIGVNTWKAYNRELTGFTIPSSLLKKFINDVRNQQYLENGTEIVTEKAQKFFETFSKSYKSNKDIEEFLAVSYFDNLSCDYVENVKDLAGYYYVGYRYYSDKLDGKKAALSYQIWSKYNTVKDLKTSSSAQTDGEKYNFVSIDMVEGDSLIFKIVYEDEKKENQIESYWSEETTEWKLSKISYTKSSKKYSLETKDEKLNKASKKKNGKSKEDNLVHGIESNIGRYIVTIPMNPFDVDFSSGTDQTLYKGFSMDFQFYEYFEGFAGLGFDLQWQVTGDNYFKLIGMDYNLQCPFDFNYFYLIPSAAIGGVYSVFSDAAYYGWYWDASLNLMFGGVIDWGIGVNFKTTYLYPIRDGESTYQIPTLGIALVFNLN